MCLASISKLDLAPLILNRQLRETILDASKQLVLEMLLWIREKLLLFKGQSVIKETPIINIR